ncbi:MAG: F0F1 ATP synthase subunit delta [Anaerolineae bacterium]
MLDLDWRTLLFQIINFGVLVAILAWLVFKPLKSKLAERGQTISDALQSAQDQEAEAARLRAHWEERRAQAEAHGEEIIRAAETRAQERSAQILSEARLQLDRLTEDMRTDLNHERDEIVSLQFEEILEGVMALSANVIRSVTTRRTHDDMVANFVAGILRTPQEQVQEYRTSMTGRVPTAFVTTPVPLTPEQSRTIADAVSSLLDRRVEIRDSVDVNIIAGIQVRLADRLVENSIRQQLVQIRDKVRAEFAGRQDILGA